MKSILPLLASATVGGLIGYSTNWVAIKMLFRPLEEKRIFGIRVPFTPGVVPRQRKALGSSIGSTVNDYLFTNEALKEVFENESVNLKLHTFVNRQIETLKESTTTPRIALEKFDVDASTITNHLAHLIEDNINFEALNTYLTSTLQPLTDSLGAITLGEIASNIEIGELSKYETKMAVFLGRVINEKISHAEDNNYTLRELLSDEVLELLKNSLQYNAPNMLGWVTNQLDTDEARNLIEQYISDLFSGNFLGSILGGILPPSTLSKMICDKFKEKLATPQTLIFVQDKLDLILNNVSNKEITKLIPENIAMAIPQISAVLVKELLPLMDKTINSTIEKYKELSVNDLSRKLNINISEKLANEMAKSLNEYLKDENNIKNLINPVVNFLLDMPFSELTKKVDDETIEILTNALSTIVVSFIDKHGNEFLEVLNVKGMVENQIDKLELLQVEEIVLSVMNNQLKAITSFGLLLGAVLGLVMPFINNWISSF